MTSQKEKTQQLSSAVSWFTVAPIHNEDRGKKEKWPSPWNLLINRFVIRCFVANKLIPIMIKFIEQKYRNPGKSTVVRNRCWWIVFIAKETLSFWASNCHTDATLVTNDGMCLHFSKKTVFAHCWHPKPLQRDTTETLRQLHWTPCVSLVPHKNTCNVSQVYALYPALKKHEKSLLWYLYISFWKDLRSTSFN